MVERLWKEIKRQIFYPKHTPPRNAPVLNDITFELVRFHHRGLLFNDDDNSALNDDYFDSRKSECFLKYPKFIQHFGKCLQHQCMLENVTKERNVSEIYQIKKRLPLPMFGVGQRQSISIDMVGLY